MLTRISAVRSFRRICTDRLDLLVVPARSTAQIGPKAHADACLLQYYSALFAVVFEYNFCSLSDARLVQQCIECNQPLKHSACLSLDFNES